MAKLEESDLCAYHVMEMVDGRREWQSGAWVNACLEFLRASGYITQYIGAEPKLTEAGRAALPQSSAPDRGEG